MSNAGWQSVLTSAWNLRNLSLGIFSPSNFGISHLNSAALPSRPAFGYFPGMKRFAALVGLVLFVALPMARAQQSPDDQYIAIYNLMQEADALQEAGQPRQALADYTQALAGLQKFQKIFPLWDSEIVTYRLNYLADKVNSLAAQLPAISP